MSQFIRKGLPMLILSIMGFLFTIQWFVPINELSTLKNYVTTFTIIVFSVSIGLGVIYAVTAELDRVRRSPSKEQYFITGSFFATMILSLFLAVYFGSAQFGDWLQGVNSTPFKFLITNVYSTQASMAFGVIFLLMVGALFRTRLSSMESSVLLIVSMTFILKSIPLFAAEFPWLSPIADFFSLTVGTGASRATTLVGAIGSLVVGVRSLIGKEITIGGRE